MPGRDRSHDRQHLLQVFCCVSYRRPITKCCRCWNCFSSIFYIIFFPFLLILVGLVLFVILLGSMLAGFLCSCYYSRTEGYALWASILCCPCLGCCSLANAVKNFCGETAKIGCGILSKYLKTIKALCCYSKPKRDSVDEMQSNKIEF